MLDTTVMPDAIARPTDSRLLKKRTGHLVNHVLAILSRHTRVRDRSHPVFDRDAGTG
jgi:hypothetical protein